MLWCEVNVRRAGGWQWSRCLERLMNYLGSLTPSPLPSQHPHKAIVLFANQNILADVRHTDVLRNVSFGDLLPFDPGSSCGVMLCNGTQTQQRNSGSLSTSVHKFVLSTIMKYNVFGCRGRGGKTKRHKSTNQRKCDKRLKLIVFF